MVGGYTFLIIKLTILMVGEIICRSSKTSDETAKYEPEEANLKELEL